MTTTPVRPVIDGAAHDVRRAWFTMLLWPVAFLLAFGIGEGLISLLGYPVGSTGDRAPLWAILTATVPALLVMVVPPVVSARFARRAADQGRRDGWIPAGILITLTTLFILTNVAAGLMG